MGCFHVLILQLQEGAPVYQRLITSVSTETEGKGEFITRAHFAFNVSFCVQLKHCLTCCTCMTLTGPCHQVSRCVSSIRAMSCTNEPEEV